MEDNTTIFRTQVFMKYLVCLNREIRRELKMFLDAFMFKASSKAICYREEDPS